MIYAPYLAFEYDYVDIQARGPIPGDIFLKLDTFRKVLETMKGYTTKTGSYYESVLALSPPRMLMYDSGRKYVYSLPMKVIRKEVQPTWRNRVVVLLYNCRLTHLFGEHYVRYW